MIAMFHERFQERPLAVITTDDPQFDPVPLSAQLRDMLPSWWLPDAWSVLDALPRTTLGKPNKAALRQMLEDGKLELLQARASN